MITRIGKNKEEKTEEERGEDGFYRRGENGAGRDDQRQYGDYGRAREQPTTYH